MISLSANVKMKYDLSEIARESRVGQRITLINVFTRTVRVTARVSIISCPHSLSHSRALGFSFSSNNHPEADGDDRLNKPLM